MRSWPGLVVLVVGLACGPRNAGGPSEYGRTLDEAKAAKRTCDRGCAEAEEPAVDRRCHGAEADPDVSLEDCVDARAAERATCEDGCREDYRLAIDTGHGGDDPDDLDPPDPEPDDGTPRQKRSQIVLKEEIHAVQEQSEWCWAATVSNVFAYAGHPVSQARIVQELYGTIGNFKSGPYGNMSALLNRSWIDDDGVAFVSTVEGLYDASVGVQAMSNETIRAALDRDRPVVLGTTSHAMVVIGMDYTVVDGRIVPYGVTAVDVFDPWPGIGDRQLAAIEATAFHDGGRLMYLATIKVQ